MSQFKKYRRFKQLLAKKYDLESKPVLDRDHKRLAEVIDELMLLSPRLERQHRMEMMGLIKGRSARTCNTWRDRC